MPRVGIDDGIDEKKGQSRNRGIKYSYAITTHVQYINRPRS